MKFAVSVASLLLICTPMMALGASTNKPQPSHRADAPKLGTSFRFDGTNLRGKYATSPSLTSTVENDKYLEDLLGAPKNFNDRIARDSDRN